jgi:predicted aldo/keto reductase-like oxidoreductase
VFNEQLAKCQVDYFDFYLCHSLNKDHFERLEKLHVYDFLQRMKKEGKITTTKGKTCFKASDGK